MIRIRNLTVDLGNFQLQNINLDIELGEYFIILGPTGAGKTVLLEALAGLHPIVDGKAWIESKEITKLNPEKRGIGMVYQDQALFPHLSVAENIAFGLKLRKCSKEEIKTRIDSIAEILGIGHLLGRDPLTLSGGEKQKVAVSRALVIEPKVLLLDEPLSALDPETRERLQGELREIHRRLKVTVIHVTHDFEEAIALGHRVAVLNDGQIAQVGTPEQILRQPESEFVASFALSRNIFTGKARVGENGSTLIDIDKITLKAITESRGEVRLCLRSEDILISKEPFRSTARNSFPGVVSNIDSRVLVAYITVTVPPDFICLITRQAFDELKLETGMKVWLTFKASAIHIFK